MEALRAALTMILGIALPFIVQAWDRERLPAPLARRTWGYATWGGALYAFGPISMLGWIFVTRAPWKRCVVAIPYTMAPLVGLVAIDLVLSLALGEPIETSASELATSALVLAIAIPLVMIAIEIVTRAWRALWRRPMPGDEWRAIARELEAE